MTRAEAPVTLVAREPAAQTSAEAGLDSVAAAQVWVGPESAVAAVRGLRARTQLHSGTLVDSDLRSSGIRPKF